MRKTPDIKFPRNRAFWFERDAATPWHKRWRKAAVYAGIAEALILLSILAIQYFLGAFDEPISIVLLRSAVIPIFLFIFVLFLYFQADSKSRRHQLHRLKNGDSKLD